MAYKTKSRKYVRKTVTRGIVHIKATFNNTLVSVTDVHGNILVQSSAGRHLKGSKKSTPHGAQLVAEFVANKSVKDYNMTTVDIIVKGPGSGRESAMRAIFNIFQNTLSIKDITPIPFNGCRPKKRRRV